MNPRLRQLTGLLRYPAADGRALLRFSAAMLLLAGTFAFALGVSGRFLPHDERYLGMTAQELCALHGCRIVHFMIHDRISFGGALIAVGLMYWWLTDGPLRQGERWAWQALSASGALGFASFFAYLGYGYLDSWHGLATLALLPCFALGLAQSLGTLMPARAAPTPSWGGAARWGRFCLLACGAGLFSGGLTILAVGTTCVFVPQDLQFMGLSAEEMHAINPRLVPLIAHDRAGFGGAVACAGIAVFASVWHARVSRGLWFTLLAVGGAGFGAGIAAHPAVGYVDPVHLAPAVLGAAVYAVGLVLSAGGGESFPVAASGNGIDGVGTSRIWNGLPDRSSTSGR